MTTNNPHAGPLILNARGTSWAECRCGWVGPVRPSPFSAAYTWARHLKEQA